MTAPNIKMNNGLTMPGFGLGTWLAKQGEVGKAVKLAIDIGYRHIDCALLYQNEKEIGAAIREKIADGSVKREDLFIVSKVWNTYHRPDLVPKGCKKTLDNFGLEYIDLYLMHWPFAFKATENGDKDSLDLKDWNAVVNDPEFWPRKTNGDVAFGDDDYLDTWKAMEDLVDRGLTKSIGVSNFNSQQLDRLLKDARIKPVNNQIEAHVYLNQKKLIDLCKQHGIVVTAYSPLGSPERPSMGTRPMLLEDETVNAIAREVKRSPGQVALRYLVEIGAIPIPKSTNAQRLKDNISIFDFKLTPGQLTRLDALDCNDRTCLMEGCETHTDYPFHKDLEF